MGDSLTINPKPVNQSDTRLDPSKELGLFNRRIEFHAARKPFKYFDNGGADFKLETLNPCSSSDSRKAGSGPAQSGLSGKKTDGKDFLESGLDSELSFGITFRRIGAGLENLGNTCFLNSVIQCLTYTEPLAAYLQSGKHKSSCHVAGFCALCAIQNHVSRALQSTGRILVPKDLVSNLRCISRNFRNARQEDAHEYMVQLLESMHKCCLPSGVPSESPGAYEKSLVHKIFGGRLRSQVQCLHCFYCSNKFDPFLDLSLEIVGVNSLYKALEHFTTKEYLDGGEKQYQCQRCKQKVRATKQLTVDKPPFVLTIHLKRFHSHDPGRKILKKVQFDCNLDLKHFVSGPYEGDLKYSLYGVLVHSGFSTHSGHYFCYVRTSNGMWYTLDDNRVYHVSEQVVLSQQAYMLFYVRDRSNGIPQKRVDTISKENMTVNANESMASNFNLDSRVSSQNDNRENRIGGAASFTAEVKKDASNCFASRFPCSTDACSLRNNGLKPVESLTLKKESVSQISSLTKQDKDTSYDRHVSNLKLVGMLPSSDQPADNQSQCNVLKTSNASIRENNIDSNGSGILKYEMGNMTSKTIICSNPQVSSAVNVSLPKVEGSPYISACEKGGGDQLVPHPESVNISRPIDLADVDSKPARKSKSKQIKHIRSMPLRSNICYMMSLRLQKRKKKQKKSKRCSSKEELLASDLISGLGPSTSYEAGRVSLSQMHSLRRGIKTSPKKGVRKEALLNTKCSYSVDATVVKEFKNRIEENSAWKSSELPSMTKLIGGGTSSCPLNGKTDAMAAHAPSVITQCLEETGVARWDGIELPAAESTWTNGDTVTTTIGYVGDEWDEEYDRGKRKKVKLFKRSFNDHNPFQEIANQKLQFKKSKVDKSSAGNQPFRI